MGDQDRTIPGGDVIELQDAIAHMIAKARVGNSVYMDGSHNPRPSEVRAAAEMVAMVREQVAREIEAEHDSLTATDAPAYPVVRNVLRRAAHIARSGYSQELERD